MKKLCGALFLLGFFLTAVTPGNAEDYWNSSNDPVYSDVRSDDPYYLLHLIHYQLYRQPQTYPATVIIVRRWHNHAVLHPQLHFAPKSHRRLIRAGR